MGLIAVAVAGPQRLTRVTQAWPHSAETLEHFARAVAGKEPGRTYYVVEVDEATWGQRRKDVLYSWHVGEGFAHEEGWWVHWREGGA